MPFSQKNTSIESMLKAHDWFHEHSEDQQKYLAGVSERLKILKVLETMQVEYVAELIKPYAPPEEAQRLLKRLLKVEPY